MRIDRITRIATLVRALAADQHLDGYKLEDVQDALEWLDSGLTTAGLACALANKGAKVDLAVFIRDENTNFARTLRPAFASYASMKPDIQLQDPIALQLEGELPPVASVMAHVALEREEGRSPYAMDRPSKP